MAGLKKFLVRRTATFIPTIIGVVFLAFIIAYAIPANPAQAWAGGQKARPEVVQRIIKEYHLDEPWYSQFYWFFVNVLTNNIVSPRTSRPVLSDILTNYFPVTVQLAIFAYIFILAFGIPLGIISALKKDTLIDSVLRVIALIGISTPIFWLAYLLIYLFFFKLRWITLAGVPHPHHVLTGIYIVDAVIYGEWGTAWNIVKRFWLPGFVLAFPGIGVIMRFVRNSFLEALSAEFTEFCEARGLRKLRIYMHVLRNALVPIVTVLGLQFGGLLCGAVITETIFALPGMGWYAINAINNLDFPALIGCVLLFALIYVTANLIVDILYAVIDPRVRY